MMLKKRDVQQKYFINYRCIKCCYMVLFVVFKVINQKVNSELCAYKSTILKKKLQLSPHSYRGARCSSVVRAFAHGAMGCRIDPSWGEPIELFLVPASAPRLV